MTSKESSSGGRSAAESGPAWRRLPLLAAGGVALVSGLWGGLLRLGWALPVPSAVLPRDHGALMVCGFLGTLIGLERAVALGRAWAYAAPLLTGLGAVALLLGAPASIAKGAVVVGSAVFVGASVAVVLRRAAAFTVTMAAGALALTVGAALWWSNRPIFGLVWWWVAFLLLTVAGERLELSRLMRRPRWAAPLFVAAAALLLLGAALHGWLPELGRRVIGISMLAIAAWLGRYDIARKTVRTRGLARYVAVCILSGYVWLALSAALLLGGGPLTVGPYYDAALHAVFVGFVFTMIFGHAPIILPAVLRVRLRYRPLFYAPLLLLHVSLLTRVAGDLGGSSLARSVGGALNVVAIVLFLASVVSAIGRPGDAPR